MHFKISMYTIELLLHVLSSSPIEFISTGVVETTGTLVEVSDCDDDTAIPV